MWVTVHNWPENHLKSRKVRLYVTDSITILLLTLMIESQVIEVQVYCVRCIALYANKEKFRSYFLIKPILRAMQNIQKPAVSSSPELQLEVAVLMIECLNLEIAADQIDPDAPLYGEGLGLDSIDVLEVALVVSKRYGMQLRADSADNQHTFSSLRNLADYIAAQRTR